MSQRHEALGVDVPWHIKAVGTGEQHGLASRWVAALTPEKIDQSTPITTLHFRFTHHFSVLVHHFTSTRITHSGPVLLQASNSSSSRSKRLSKQSFRDSCPLSP